MRYAAVPFPIHAHAKILIGCTIFCNIFLFVRHSTRVCLCVCLSVVCTVHILCTFVFSFQFYLLPACECEWVSVCVCLHVFSPILCSCMWRYLPEYLFCNLPVDWNFSINAIYNIRLDARARARDTARTWETMNSDERPLAIKYT